MADFAKAIGFILAHEGGSKYTNIPEDRGGPTKWGITQRTLANWRAHAVTAADVKALSELEAADIYRNRYWRKCRCDEIKDQTVATKLFDVAVNLGVMRRGEDAAEILQRAVNCCSPPTSLKVDGWIGDQTIAATNLCDPEHLVDALCMEQRDYYLELIARNPSQKKFRRGWMNRAAWPYKEIIQ
jgi:lysozyme family protein